jgi:hypothetical protein
MLLLLLILIVVAVVITMNAEAAVDAVQNVLFLSLTQSQLQGHRLCSADDGQWWQYVMAMQVPCGCTCAVLSYFKLLSASISQQCVLLTALRLYLTTLCAV